jgi:hypothetical protein
VADGARDLGLLLEPLDGLRVLAELLVQELEGHPLADVRVLGLVHHAHPAFTEDLHDPVSIGYDGSGAEHINLSRKVRTGPMGQQIRQDIMIP